MNMGQTLLTFAAMTILSLAILNVNRTLSNCDITLSQSRYRMEALSILNSYIAQASQHYFDEVTTDTSSEKTLNDFTQANSFGFDADDYGIIDDFDDYHNYVIADTGQSGVIYNIAFKVDYVQISGNKVVPIGNRAYHKRMTISIYDTYDPPLLSREVNGAKVNDSLKVDFVYSYWFYN